MKQAESADLRRKEIQHKRWTERVAEPLQKTIERYIDGQTSQDIERRRRWLLEQYLDYCNKKVSLNVGKVTIDGFTFVKTEILYTCRSLKGIK